MKTMHSAQIAALLLLGWVATASGAVPSEVQYQGLLLDDVGNPITANVTLDFELFDAITGGGSLWTESHASVSVLDGVYEVALGSITPLAPAILSGGAVFLEIAVDSETLTPRQQLLAVPFALLAEEALVAQNTTAVGGIPSSFTVEMFEHFAFDGGAPANDDPSEGLADTDSDGIANFVDSDNDNDGLPDVTELSQGSDINLPTPIVTSTSPNSGRQCLTTTVDILGANFEAGALVDFGSQSALVPNSIAPSSIEVDVGPQPVGPVAVGVTNPTLETDMASGIFTFFDVTPAITGFVPAIANAAGVTAIQVVGTNFEPGLTVQFGTQTPVPSNVTSTSFDATVGPQPAGSVNVTVTNAACGEQGSSGSFGFEVGLHVVFVTSANYDGNLGGIAGADAICASHASAAALTGTFLAWIADGATSPASRFLQGANPYLLTNGTVVADNWTDLTDGTLDAAINRTETGATVTSAAVHSNVQADGTTVAGLNNCTSWTTTAGSERIGNTGATGGAWTKQAGTYDCSFGARLYCFEQ